MNRRERRAHLQPSFGKSTEAGLQAYQWAIESDRPWSWAKLLQQGIDLRVDTATLEKVMGDKLTFSKMKVSVFGITQNAFQCNIRIDSRTNVWARAVWIPRSNIRSDDDKRLDEIEHQLESVPQVNTFIHVADWFRDSRKWTAVES